MAARRYGRDDKLSRQRTMTHGGLASCAGGDAKLAVDDKLRRFMLRNQGSQFHDLAHGNQKAPP